MLGFEDPNPDLEYYHPILQLQHAKNDPDPI
jgi:hypothetical protein